MPDQGDEYREHDTCAASAKGPINSLFQLPTPIRRLFDRFPLKAYPADELPRRAPRNRDVNVLHIFTTEDAAKQHAPSFNPACLKWQAYLKFCGVQFHVVAANNHASPSGVLPFLAPADSSSFAQPIPSNKILKWISSQTGITETASGMQYEAYTSLISHRIRSAWLFTLYLDEHNSEAVAKKLYIYPASSNPVVQMTLYRQLQQAARDELLKTRSYIRETELYLEAESAFEALSTLLGNDAHFLGNERPTLFDASVFAYTHLLLDESFSWQNTRLADSLKERRNLVQHRNWLLERYFHGSNG